MSIFTDRRGRQRWTCWSTGNSGTAIDLVSINHRIDVSASIQWLADRTASGPTTPRPTRRRQPPKRSGASADLRDYVHACVRELHKPSGAVARHWLTERRLNTAIIALNDVGYDPGPRQLRRARGLPYRGEGIVLPTFDRLGQLVYAQTRISTSSEPAASTTTRPDGTRRSLRCPGPAFSNSEDSKSVICEGVIDALTVAGIRVRATALLSPAMREMSPHSSRGFLDIS